MLYFSKKVDDNLFQNIKNNLFIKNLNFEYKNLENKNWNSFWNQILNLFFLSQES